MDWNKIEDSLPDYDEVVLWQHENGNFMVASIDKDDNDWWNNEFNRYTHWARIRGPHDQPDQDILWDELSKLLIGKSKESGIELAKLLYSLIKKNN